MPTPTTSGYAPTNGVEVYYASYGEGAPIVVLHGGLMSGSSWAPVIATLAQTHQVITLDLQGHGHTLPFDRPMTFEAMADDVAGVIDFLKLGKPAVMGYSMGATTALRLALQHPDKVSRLIHVSAPYNFAEGWHDYNREGMRSVTSALAQGMMQSPMYATYAAEAPDAKNFPVLLDKIGDMMRTGFDYSAEVGELTVPTMLVYGDWDAVRTSHAARFFELLGGGLQDAGWDGSGMNRNRLAILPGLTHYDGVAATRRHRPRLHRRSLINRHSEATMGKSIVTAPDGANWFEIVRDFEAPRALVWKMYTEPQHLVHFWGPKGGSVPRCELDLRVGGMWHHTMRMPDGNDFSYSSRYLEIVPPEKLVYRDAPLNASPGDELGPPTMISTIRLEEIGTTTRVIAHIELTSTDARDATIRHGFALMVDGGHDQLEEYLRQFL